MAVDTEVYKGLTIITGTPSGSGGALINNNFIEIADQLDSFAGSVLPVGVAGNAVYFNSEGELDDAGFPLNALAFVTDLNHLYGTLTVEGPIIQTVVALTYSSTINTDCTLGNYFTVTLTGNPTIANPTDAENGQKITYRIKQDATGGRVPDWDTNFRFSGGIEPDLNTDPNKVNYIGFIYDSIDGKFDCIAERFNF